ncbi:hypothetical protein SLS62_002060 [Diatrype stigma]|uniref:VWFA domain-containing protein n=1 Tax=Diatrype stigma TaxID=117547 RepID=A0AAN9UUU6_9PEZI
MGGKDRLKPDQSRDGSKSPSRLDFLGRLHRSNTESSQGSNARSEAAPSISDIDKKHAVNPFDDPPEPPPSYEVVVKEAPAYPFAEAWSTSEKLPEYTITKEMVGESLNDPTFLSHFDTVFLIDDSTSMQENDGQGGFTRWNETREALGSVAPICVKYDKDGVDIHFLNDRRVCKNITSEKEVIEVFEAVKPVGYATPLGSRLEYLLCDYLNEYRKNTAIKPINIIVITDGIPSPWPEMNVGERIGKMVHRLLEINKGAQKCQFGIQFFQVGMDEAATEFLKKLDNGREHVPPGWDVIDTATFPQGDSECKPRLTYSEILKVVLGAVNKRLDEEMTVERKLPKK